MPEKIDVEMVAAEAGVDNEDAEAVLEALVMQGWLKQKYIEER